MFLASLDLFPFGFIGFWAAAAAVFALVVNIFFALAVYRDAYGHGSRVVFVSPAVWGAATFLGGVLVATAYWLMHHSTFRNPQHGPEAQQDVATDDASPDREAR